MKICVLGSGTWGCAISNLLSSYGSSISCYSHKESEASLLNATYRHKNLPNSILSPSINFSSDLKACINDCEMIVFATPSSCVRDTANSIKPFFKNQLIVNLAKGIENETFLTASEIIEDVLKNKDEVVALTGPSHAEEVSLFHPTCIVSACKNNKNAEAVQRVFHSEVFRVYTNHDRKGCELCGAFKNIIAIACGISDGLGYGDNAKAALITRGVHELERLGEALGCNPKTFSGLAGIGDLIVTCTSPHSRNHQAGVYIGEGYDVQTAIEKVGMVVEGVNSLIAAKALCDKYKIDMPIVYGVYKIVNQNKDARSVASDLLSRDKKNEFFE